MTTAAPGSSRPSLSSRWALGTIVGFLVGLGVLTAAVCRDTEPSFGWDRTVERAVQSASWPGLETLMRGVSLAGDHVYLSTLLVLAACAVLLRAGRRRETAVLVLVVIAGQVFKIAMKELVARPRPGPDVVQVRISANEIHSFPSGHTVHYVVFFGFLWFLALQLLRPGVLRPTLLVLLGGLVLLVGSARVYLGAHWPSDVLAGYLLGGALLLASIRLYGRWTSPRAASTGDGTPAPQETGQRA